MKMGELNVEIEICCRAEFITYACEILRKSVKVFCRFLNFFTERREKRVSGFQSSCVLSEIGFIVACYATLHLAWSIQLSVGWSVTVYFRGLWPRRSCPNALVTANTTPANPHATGLVSCQTR